MKKLFHTGVIIVSALLLHSCQLPAARTTVQELDFSVDTQLVDKLVHNAALSLYYRLPSQWQQGTDFTLTDIRNTPVSQYQDLRKNYRLLLNADHRWKKIVRSSFTKDGFYVHQYMMLNDNRMNFRLIFFRDMKPFTQIDFRTSACKDVNGQNRLLESIVGSLETTDRLSFTNMTLAALQHP